MAAATPAQVAIPARPLPRAALHWGAIIWSIAWKEIRSYFSSFLAYVLGFGILFVTWYFYLVVLAQMSQDVHIELVINVIPQLFLFTIPLMTMRLFSEEKNTGTIELLLTSPVTDVQVVLGKFLGSLSMVGFILATTVHLPLITARYGTIDFGPIKAIYIGTLLIGAAFLAIGIFMSTLSDNQVVSGFLTFATLVLLLVMAILARTVTSEWLGIEWSKVLTEVSVFSHLENMVAGDVLFKDVVYYVTFTLFFLYCAVKSLESRKWR